MATEQSEIQQYFSGSTVFITGATGLVGKLLIEKLLRTCLDVTRIYILIRGKKGKSPEERFQKLLDNVIFERIKKEDPKLFQKLFVVEGDCTLTDLGVGHQDKQKLIDEVGCVFHCAADVRFNKTIRDVALSNVRGTKDLLVMAKQMNNLTAFIYVSTAYSHCVKSEIDEKLYNPPITGKNLLTLVDSLDDELLEKITPTLVGNWPNTYAFSKAVAEEVVGAEGQGLPVAIVRPSVITPTVKEPMPGWIDNVYGPTGMFVGGGLGIIHTVHADKQVRADVVPADVVVNCVIAAAWNVSKTKEPKSKSVLYQENNKFQSNDNTNIPVYNCVCSVDNCYNWKEIMRVLEKVYLPPIFLMWYPYYFVNKYYFMHLLCVLFLHQVPAYVADFICYCIAKPTRLVSAYKKIHEVSSVNSYFILRQWRFRNTNTRQLWSNLSEEDQMNFGFNMDALDWQEYLFNYMKGMRIYILKDPLETLPQAHRKYVLITIAHYTVMGLLLFGMIKIWMVLWNFVV